MRTSWIVSGLIISGLACIGLLAAFTAAAQVEAPAPLRQANATADARPEAPAPPAPSAAASPAGNPVESAAETADEAAIRRNVDAFTKAYDGGDAKAIAALFLPDAEIITKDGTTNQGRDAIENDFADIFKQYPKASIKVDVSSIRFVSPMLAIEEGTSLVTHDPDQAAEHTRYEVVHVKQGGKWLMASARDLPDEQAEAQDQLNQLHWLIGEWVDENPDALVNSSYRWSTNHHFILCDFTVNLNGQMAMTGTQRIGWDPLAKTIRSWAFDSEGGFVEGVWSREGNKWIIKNTGVTSDGKAASSTNYLTRVRKHHLTWESRDRFVGGEKTPDIGPISIARQPPTPGALTKASATKHSEPRP